MCWDLATLKNDYVQSMMFLEHISLKDSYEKDGFFKKLPSLIEALPGDVARYKVLPELVKGLDYGTANFRVLTPLLQIAGELSADEYRLKIAPSVIKWFRNPDRSLRLNLLKKLDTFVDNLPKSVINDDIFKHVAEGFTDKSPVLREMTVRSMLILAPKLKESTLQTEVLRHFAKLQMDPEPGIRANTTLCLGKLTPHLTKSTRQKVLAAAFVRALKDTFAPSRLAGVMSLGTTSEEYAVKDIATRIVPALSLRTIDPDPRVRTEAFKAIQIFIERLEAQHSSMTDSEYVKEATKDESNSTVLGWASNMAAKATSHVTAVAANKVLGTPMPKPKPKPVAYNQDHVDQMAERVRKEALASAAQKEREKKRQAPAKRIQQIQPKAKPVAIQEGWGSSSDEEGGANPVEEGWDDSDEGSWGNSKNLPPLKKAESAAAAPAVTVKPKPAKATLGTLISAPPKTAGAAPAATGPADWGQVLAANTVQPQQPTTSTFSTFGAPTMNTTTDNDDDDGWGDLSLLESIGKN